VTIKYLTELQEIAYNVYNHRIPSIFLIITAITVIMLSGMSAFDMAAATESRPYNYDEIADTIQSDSRFEKFPSHVLDAIRAGEIDEYAIRMIISKAPQDVGSYGSNTNVAKLTEIIENEMGLESGSGGAHITLLAPVEILPELAKYSYVERFIGKDFGIKHSNEGKTQGTIKYSYGNKVYDVLYNSTNTKISGFTEFRISFLPLEDDSIIRVTYPINFTDTVKTVVTERMLTPFVPKEYINATLTSLITYHEKADLSNYEILELDDKYVKIQWNYDNGDYDRSISFYRTVISTSEDLVFDSEIKSDSSGLPEWIKNNAGWWATDQIDDDTFKAGIEFLIKSEIKKIDKMRVGADNSNQDESDTENKTILKWIKNNAGWWAEDKLTDDDFMLGIEYLVENKIIKVPS
jgi:hypothetical protein